jgi:hypothetical protein
VPLLACAVCSILTINALCGTLRCAGRDRLYSITPARLRANGRDQQIGEIGKSGE